MDTPRYRIGNDLTVLWAICNRDGSPFNLDGKRVKLFVVNERGREEVEPIITTLPDGTTNNVIRWDFKAEEQKVLGSYALSAEISITEDSKVIKKDYSEAFNLVSRSEQESEDEGDMSMTAEGDLYLTSKLDVFRFGIPKIEINTKGHWTIDGVDSGQSALGGGQGLVNKIYNESDFDKEFDNESVIDTFNASAIAKLHKQVVAGPTFSVLNPETDNIFVYRNGVWMNMPAKELIGLYAPSAGGGGFPQDMWFYGDDGRLYTTKDVVVLGNLGVGGPGLGGNGEGTQVVTALSELTDVSIYNPKAGEILVYENGKWINKVFSVDIPVMPDLEGYATEAWVERQGYVKATDITDPLSKIETFSDWFEWADKEHTTIRTKYNFFSKGQIAVGEKGEADSPASGGGITGIQVNGNIYNDADEFGIITLPNYPTELRWESVIGRPTKLTDLENDLDLSAYAGREYVDDTFYTKAAAIVLSQGLTASQEAINKLNVLLEWFKYDSVNDAVYTDKSFYSKLQLAAGERGENASAGGGTITGIRVNGKDYASPDEYGILTIPDYPTSLTWDDITGKPTDLGQFTNEAGYIKNNALEGYATQGWVEAQQYALAGNVYDKAAINQKEKDLSDRIAPFEKWFSEDSAGNLYTTYNFYSTKQLATGEAGAAHEGEGGGGRVNGIIINGTEYVEVDNYGNLIVSETLATLADLASYLKNTDADNKFATKTYVNDTFATITSLGGVDARLKEIEEYFNGSGEDADNKINKWNEIVAFLNATEDTTLAGILAAYTLKTDHNALAGRVTANEGAISGIITTLGSHTSTLSEHTTAINTLGNKLNPIDTWFDEVGKYFKKESDGVWYVDGSFYTKGQNAAGAVGSPDGGGSSGSGVMLLESWSDVPSSLSGYALSAALGIDLHERFNNYYTIGDVDNRFSGINSRLATLDSGMADRYTKAESDGRYLKLSGGTISGHLILNNQSAIHSYTTSGTALELFNISSNNNLSIGYSMAGVGGSYIYGNAIYLRYGSSRTTGLILNQSGNVTIGGSDIAEQNYKLATDGKIYIRSPYRKDYPSLGSLSSNSDFCIEYAYSYGVYYGLNAETGNGFVQVGLNNSSKITYNYLIQPLGGNVGIGTTDPQAKLHVEGLLYSYTVTSAASLSLNRNPNSGAIYSADKLALAIENSATAITFNAYRGNGSKIGVPLTIDNYGGLTASVGISTPYITIGGITLSVVDGVLKIDGNVYTTGQLGVGSVGQEGGGTGGGGVLLLNTWPTDGGSYAGYALGGNLGIDLKNRVTTLEGKTIGWSEITSKPTTLSGYGITDALSTAGGTIEGVTTFKNWLYVNALTDLGSYVRFYDKSGGFLGGVGVNSSKIPFFYDSKGISYNILTSAGGTIEGTHGTPLVLNTTHTEVGLPFRVNNFTKAWIGWTPTHGAHLYTYTGSYALGIGEDGIAYFGKYSNKNTLIHSGNVGDYALKYIGATEVAKSELPVLNTFGLWHTIGPYIRFGISEAYNITIRSSANKLQALVNASKDGDWQTIAFTDSDISGNAASATRARYIETMNYTGTGWYGDTYKLYAQWFDGTICDWKSTDDSNNEYKVRVDIAKKLNTARTIWGQNFDGTGNVSGALTGASSVRYNSDTYYGLYVKGSGFSSTLSDNDFAINAESNVLFCTNGEKRMLINSSGNVTIGDSDLAGTSSRLYVDGNILLKYNSANTIGTAYSSGDMTAYNRIEFNGSTNGLRYISGSWTSSNVVAHNFLVGTSNSSALALMNNGNVLIGSTTDSGYKLDVNGTLRATAANFGGDSGINIGMTYADNTSGAYDLIERRASGAALYLQYNHTGNILMCQGGGEVGIGITNPVYKLDVAGSIRTTSSLTIGTIVLTDENGTLKIQGNAYTTGQLATGEAGQATSGGGSVILDYDSIVDALGFTPASSSQLTTLSNRVATIERQQQWELNSNGVAFTTDAGMVVPLGTTHILGLDDAGQCDLTVGDSSYVTRLYGSSILANGSEVLTKANTSFTRSYSSGTKIGTIKIGGVSTDIYVPSSSSSSLWTTEYDMENDIDIIVSTKEYIGTNTIVGWDSAGTCMNDLYIGFDGYTIWMQGSVDEASDMRLKTVIDAVNLDIRDIAFAPIFNYVFKSRPQGRQMLGSSAQYWQTIAPCAVSENDKGNLAMNYGAIALASVVAVAKKTLTHEEEIAELKSKVQSLESRLARYKLN